jgi:hypothetical protein
MGQIVVYTVSISVVVSWAESREQSVSVPGQVVIVAMTEVVTTEVV